jgi:MraZ protein
MTLFLSTFLNKIDKKGRVSVPAQFRNILAVQHFKGVIAYPSFLHHSIEACGIDRIEALNKAIDKLDVFSEQRDAFATIILGSSMQLAFDSEGRITLPESLIEFANISEQAYFVGKGQTFEIWNPPKFNEYLEKAREVARQQRNVLNVSEGNI